MGFEWPGGEEDSVAGGVVFVRKPSGAELSLNFETITMKPNRGRKNVDSAKDGSKFIEIGKPKQLTEK